MGRFEMDRDCLRLNDSDDKAADDGKHLLTEHKHETMSVDSFIGLGEEIHGRASKMEEACLEFDFAFGCCPDYSGTDFYTTLEGEAGLKLEILDGFLDDVEEVEDIYASQDLLIMDENFLTDAGPKETVVKSEPVNVIPNAARRSDSETTAPTPPLYDLRPRRARCHSLAENGESEHEVTTSESEEEEVAVSERSRKDRRQHQRMWTPAEVVKLVDGISMFGVGKWTNIKNHFFQSTAHRTPIDLRDKWRNLLQASCAHSRNQGEKKKKRRRVEEEEDDDDERWNGRPLGKHIMKRVNEVAALHPYPCSYSKSSRVDFRSQSQTRNTSMKTKKKKKKTKRRQQ